VLQKRQVRFTLICSGVLFRAELIKFEDIDSLGSEKAVKDAGKMYLRGKDYIIEAGDILTIRFSV